MTGLYENINELQNVKSLTFLYRAPKMVLKPLSISNIARNYEKNLNINEEMALKLAKLTKGYSFAFQALGFLMWEKTSHFNEIINEYNRYLEDYVYEKIWSELSHNDQKMAYAVAKTPGGKVSEIKKVFGADDNNFNQYRNRLKKKGLVDGEWGYMRFTLPLFEEFVVSNYFDD